MLNTSPIQLFPGDAIARVVIERPDHGNKLTRGMMRELSQAIGAAAHDPASRIVLLDADGPDFCLGRDGRGETREGLKPHEIWRQMMGAVLGVYEAIREAPVPVVARVRGRAVGFGAALAASCDVTLACASCRLSFPEIEHDIPPTMALSAAVSRASHKALLWLVYSGTVIDAQRAREAGLVSEVIADDSFDAQSLQFVQQLATRPRLVLETIKRYMHNAPELSSRMASEYAGVLMALVRS